MLLMMRSNCDELDEDDLNQVSGGMSAKNFLVAVGIGASVIVIASTTW